MVSYYARTVKTKAGDFSTPIGETLDWTYYCFVKEHPICYWKTPTYILCGGQDTVCEPDTVSTFAKRFPCQLKLVPEVEHYFHTPEQLDIFSSWRRRYLIGRFLKLG